MIFNKIALWFIRLYQKTLSPDKGVLKYWLQGTVCSHEPHCSEYAKQCFEKYPFFRALDYTASRIISCTPSMTINHDPSSYSVVFFSGSPIGIPFMEKIIDDDRFDITGVVTMPDTGSGRGRIVKENKVATKASERLSPDKIGKPNSLRVSSKKRGKEAQDFEQRLKDISPDFIVVVAYGKIIPQSILDIPAIAPINVHGSLLPKYRGASPLQSVFLNNEKKTGLTIMLMNDSLDEGDIITTKETELPLHRTVVDLISWTKSQGPQLLVDTLRQYGKKEVTSTPQDHSAATVTGKIKKEYGFIDILNDTLESIVNKHRAYALRPKISFVFDGKRIGIETLEVNPEIYKDFKDSNLLGLFGSIDGSVKQLNPAIIKCDVKPEGKKTISRESFENGYLKKSS